MYGNKNKITRGDVIAAAKKKKAKKKKWVGCASGSQRTTAKDGLTVKQANLVDDRKGKKDDHTPHVAQLSRHVRARLKRKQVLNE